MLDQQYSQDSMNRELASNVTMVKLNVDETLAGFATFGRDKSDQFRAVKLYKLYLLQSFHGQGLGSMLLTHVENESIDQGFEKGTLTGRFALRLESLTWIANLADFWRNSVSYKL